MAQCIALTKKGIQCKKQSSFNHHTNTKLFCAIHIKSIPDKVILENTNEEIEFTDIQSYINLINKINIENNEKQNKEKEEQELIARKQEHAKLCDIYYTLYSSILSSTLLRYL